MTVPTGAVWGGGAGQVRTRMELSDVRSTVMLERGIGEGGAVCVCVCGGGGGGIRLV